MLNKSRLIMAAALFAVGSSVVGPSIASAQAVTEHGWRSDRTDGAYRGNVDERTYEIQKFGRLGP